MWWGEVLLKTIKLPFHDVADVLGCEMMKGVGWEGRGWQLTAIKRNCRWSLVQGLPPPPLRIRHTRKYSPTCGERCWSIYLFIFLMFSFQSTFIRKYLRFLRNLFTFTHPCSCVCNCACIFLCRVWEWCCTSSCVVLCPSTGPVCNPSGTGCCLEGSASPTSWAQVPEKGKQTIIKM